MCHIRATSGPHIRASAASVTPETRPMRRSLSRLIIQRISRTLRVLVFEFQTARERFGDFGKSSGSLRFNSFGSQSSESPVSPLCPHTSAGYCVCVGHPADYQNDLSSSLQIRNDNLLLITHNPSLSKYISLVLKRHWCPLDRKAPA